MSLGYIEGVNCPLCHEPLTIKAEILRGAPGNTSGPPETWREADPDEIIAWWLDAPCDCRADLRNEDLRTDYDTILRNSVETAWVSGDYEFDDPYESDFEDVEFTNDSDLAVYEWNEEFNNDEEEEDSDD